MSQVRRRRAAILDLVSSRRLETQDDLVEGLRGRGIEASQASVSRDITALGLVKVGGRWARPTTNGLHPEPLEQRIAAYLLGVEVAGDNLVVLRTPAGEAQGVALALDRLDLEEVVGTVAGDDTVFVAVADAAAGRRLRSWLEGLNAG
jgi:transcriptional regulator of arginine metabolism